MVNSYAQISQSEAKTMMEAGDGHVIVDVRTQDEYDHPDKRRCDSCIRRADCH